MSKKSSKPNKKDKDVIGPNQRTIEIAHRYGEKTAIQKLSIPWRRPFKNVYQFKCTLLDTKPPVWRRLQVPESYTFYDLHVAIQDTMDWLDYHLHCFMIPGIGTREYIAQIECPWGEPWEMDPNWLFTTEVPIKEYFKNPSDRAIYNYDYGDNWEMIVTLEKILPKTKYARYPVCVGGQLAAPPEDCGSTPGYYRCIEAFEAGKELEERPDTEDKEELLELLVWIGNWNPYEFDPKKILFENPRDRFIMALDLE